MRKLLLLSTLLFIAVNANCQEKLTSSESEIRLLSPEFEDLSDSVINGTRVKEIGYPNMDSTNLKLWGEWFYFFIKDNCFFVMFRPENEAARQALQDLCLKYGGRIVLCERYNIFVGVKP